MIDICFYEHSHHFSAWGHFSNFADQSDFSKMAKYMFSVEIKVLLSKVIFRMDAHDKVRIIILAINIGEFENVVFRTKIVHFTFETIKNI